MNWLFTTLTVFLVIASVLLTIVILLQNGKGEGLASNFVSGNQTFGVRETASWLEKISWGLITFILVVSIISSFTLSSKRSGIDVTRQIEQSATETQMEFPSAPIQMENPATTTPEAN